MGMFAVACMGCDKMAKEFEDMNDDYSKIMVQVGKGSVILPVRHGIVGSWKYNPGCCFFVLFQCRVVSVSFGFSFPVACDSSRPPVFGFVSILFRFV